MSGRTRDELGQKSQRALIAHAFYRLESALTIALTILLIAFWPKPFGWWHWWYWLVLGGVAELLIILTSLTDRRAQQRAMANMMRERCNPRTIKSAEYRNAVVQALDYGEKIETIIARLPAGFLREHLQSGAKRMTEWIEGIYALARRLDAYERDSVLARDRRRLPKSIARLEHALGDETDPGVRQQIEATLAAKGEQRQNLLALENEMESAQFSLEETLSALGTVYSQFQLIRARKQDQSRARSVEQDIEGQVQKLEDIIVSMNNLYARK